MRAGAGVIVGLGAILIATSAWGAGRYDPAYPVCAEVYDDNGSRIECFFTSMEQCKMGQDRHTRDVLQQPRLCRSAAGTGCGGS